jgi:hypothetical protein
VIGSRIVSCSSPERDALRDHFDNSDLSDAIESAESETEVDTPPTQGAPSCQRCRLLRRLGEHGGKCGHGPPTELLASDAALGRPGAVSELAQFQSWRSVATA